MKTLIISSKSESLMKWLVDLGCPVWEVDGKPQVFIPPTYLKNLSYPKRVAQRLKKVLLSVENGVEMRFAEIEAINIFWASAKAPTNLTAFLNYLDY